MTDPSPQQTNPHNKNNWAGLSSAQPGAHKWRRGLGLLFKILTFFMAIYLICNYWWLREFFGPVKADQLIFHLQVPIEATSNSFFPSYLAWCIMAPLAGAIFYGLFLIIGSTKLQPKCKILYSFLFPVSLLIGSLIYGELTLKVHRPLAHLLGWGSSWEAPPELEQSLAEAQPAKNLVLIFLESMESTYSSPQVFGQSLLPELEALQGLSFANYHQADGAGWTLAALAATLCGRPVTVFSGDYQGHFWPQTICLPDVLAAHGYNLRFLQGGSSRFAGTDWLLKDHHLAPARDWEYYQNRHELAGQIGAPDWGFKDSVLYALAKEELTELASQPRPFALIMMTIDTHGVEGFLDESCPKTFDDFRDVVRCSSLMASDFINWIKSQSFGPETVIVVLGDHQVMANTISKKYLEPQGNNRRLFNTILAGEMVIQPNSQMEMNHLKMLPLILKLLAAPRPGHQTTQVSIEDDQAKN